MSLCFNNATMALIIILISRFMFFHLYPDIRMFHPLIVGIIKKRSFTEKAIQPIFGYKNFVTSFFWISCDPIKGASQFICLIHDTFHHERRSLWTDDVVQVSLVVIEAAFKALSFLIIVLRQSK